MKRLANQGFTLIEIMIVVAIIALLAAIAIPNVLRGRTSANEASAVGNLRAIVSGLEMYRSVNSVYPLDVPANTWLLTMYGAGAVPAACALGLAPDPDFGPQPFCNTMAGGATAATGLVQGYRYTYAAGAVAGSQYTVLAVPANVGNTGSRSFFANESAVIRHCTEATSGAVGVATAAGMADDATIDVAPTAPCA